MTDVAATPAEVPAAVVGTGDGVGAHVAVADRRRFQHDDR